MQLMTATAATRGKSSAADATLPWAALLAMACSAFVIIMTETMPAGLLPQIASGLSTSQGAAGQLVAAYAAGTVLAAIPAIALTRGLRRKPLLLAGIGGFVAANLLTAAAGTYPLVLTARLVGGAFSGLVWGMLTGYARAVVPQARQGTGLAVAMAGVPAALAVGTPLGSLLGSVVGWRWAFAALSAVALGLIGWVLVSVPDRPGQTQGRRTPMRRVLMEPGLRPIVIVVFVWMLAHNLLYTYVAPFLKSAGVSVHVDVLLATFGVAALLGVAVTGRLVDRMLRRLALTSLVGFVLVALLLVAAADHAGVVYAAAVIWGLSFGGAATQLQTAAADAAGDDTDATSALVTTAWNVAIFGGSALGGLMLSGLGADSFPWALLILSLGAAAIVTRARHHAFTPGQRADA